MKGQRGIVLLVLVMLGLVTANPLDPFHGLPDDAVCVPGSHFTVECNWCLCGQDGYAGCTKIGCEGPPTYPVPLCEGDAIWKQDCNICRCSNGKGLCTKRLCHSF